MTQSMQDGFVRDDTTRALLVTTGGPKYKTGRYYGPYCHTNDSATNGAQTIDFSPFVVPVSATFDRICAEVTVIGTVGKTIRLAIYNDDGTGYPGTLRLDAGTIPADVVQVNELTIAHTLSPGVYWLAARTSDAASAPSVRRNASPAAMYPVGANSAAAGISSMNYEGYSVGGLAVGDALPDPAPLAMNSSGRTTRIVLRST